MHKSDIIAYFDSRAEFWDEEMIKKDSVIAKILDNTGLTEGMDILDVACGTGVMFPYYLERGAKSVTGIDISPNMARIAADKFSGEANVKVLCGDVEELEAKGQFDLIVVYNAFPHFPEPERLICRLSSLLRSGGRLTVAHGASRETIDKHHEGPASKVSIGLMEADALKEIFAKYLTVETMLSTDEMYQVSGVKL